MISKAVLKSIKALKLKKYRTKEQKFLVEGIKSVNELIKEGWETELILVTELAQTSLLDSSGVEVVKQEVLKSVSQLSTNQDCLAVANMPKPVMFNEAFINDHIVALDGIQDPGNLGTIVRTLDWFGFKKIICSKDTVDFYNSKTISSTMGSFTRIQPIYLDLIQFLRETELPVFGLDMEGTNISDLKQNKPAVFVLGNEANGIRTELRKEIDQFVTIPGKGDAESLNVGISAGILIHELSNL